MTAKLLLVSWRSWALTQIQRRQMLARKAFGRYHNQLLAHSFLSWQALPRGLSPRHHLISLLPHALPTSLWQAFVRSCNRETERKMLRAAAFWSGKTLMLLRYVFAEMRRAVASRSDELRSDRPLTSPILHTPFRP
jgi:hypothetical protein